MTLTDAQIKRHLGSDEALIVRDSTGLYLRAGKQRATWLLGQTENGKTRKTRLGNYPAMSIAMARRERDRLTGANNDMSVTVREAVESYRLLVCDKLKSGELRSDDMLPTRLRGVCNLAV